MGVGVAVGVTTPKTTFVVVAAVFVAVVAVGCATDVAVQVVSLVMVGVAAVVSRSRSGPPRRSCFRWG